MRKLRWMDRSVQKITGGIGPVGERLVRDWVLGSVVAGTTILSGVARALDAEKKGFEAALERLSRGLKKQTKAIRAAGGQYRVRAARAMKKHSFDVVAIDLSDIIKPYGRKMPFLADVRDGSKSRKERPVIEKGWQTVEIVACRRKDHVVLPLVRHVFSTVHPSFKSEQQELRQALESLAGTLPKGVRAVLDRGFDGNSYFDLLDEFFEDWAVRQRGDRNVRLVGQEEWQRMSTLADAVAKTHEARPRVVRKGEQVRIDVRFGYATVELPGGREFRRRKTHRQVGLVVAERHTSKDPSELPMILLVRRPIRTPAEARRWVEDYYRRWGAEEETRAGKQLGGVEDLRVLHWTRITNLVALTVITEGLLALLSLDAPRRAARLARSAPIDGDVPAFALYRLWMAVAILLRAISARR